MKYAKREAEDLQQWLESDRIENIRFPTTEPAVDVLFDNQLFVRLNFDGPNYTFEGNVEIRDRKHVLGTGVELQRTDVDVLLMAYNVLNSDETDGFIRGCGEHVKDLWTD